MARSAMVTTTASTVDSMRKMNHASAICGLGGGLGDAHGVDESVRDEEEELHSNQMELLVES